MQAPSASLTRSTDLGQWAQDSSCTPGTRRACGRVQFCTLLQTNCLGARARHRLTQLRWAWKCRRMTAEVDGSRMTRQRWPRPPGFEVYSACTRPGSSAGSTKISIPPQTEVSSSRALEVLTAPRRLNSSAQRIKGLRGAQRHASTCMLLFLGSAPDLLCPSVLQCSPQHLIPWTAPQFLARA